MKHFCKILLSVLLCAALIFMPVMAEEAETKPESSYIKWLDFDVTAPMLREAAELDILSHGGGGEDAVVWYELLALYAARCGGVFSSYKKGDLKTLCETAPEHGGVDAWGQGLENAKTYRFYKEGYAAVLSGMLGEYREYRDGAWVDCYGVKAYSPIASGFSYTHYDDYGASRSYGYQRHHEGHDMLGDVGTPITAVESGIVEACGWNQYGGWRIGIRSFDGQRYYYYAHLRRGHPYNDMYEGKIVSAGEVIGYLGMTGYSAKEDVNNIDTPHLHFGMELIFAPEQKDAVCQIWIDCYALTQFLDGYRAKVSYDEASGEWYAVGLHDDPSLPD
ncbi:MAG: M23 family metallopeptidase [Clostridia bacterium]|nr:M23 family metallopeptidase [Clostridia bacterium]